MSDKVCQVEFLDADRAVPDHGKLPLLPIRKRSPIVVGEAAQLALVLGLLLPREVQISSCKQSA